jgi:hypothetical protein
MNVAFISYSHHDAKIAEWLQKSLEHYRISHTGGCHNPADPSKYTLSPIFRDRTDLSGGILADVIFRNLEDSLFLIVICSRRAARSEWVNKEVQYFIDHGRQDMIIPVVIDGVPYCETSRECLPKALIQYTKEHPENELLCIDYTAEGPYRTQYAVVARILGVPFDMIFNRQNRRRRNRLVSAALVCILMVFGLLYLLTPIDTRIILRDPHSHLPLAEDAEVIVNDIHYVLSGYENTIDMPDMPGYMRGHAIDVLFYGTFYDTIRTRIRLGIGFSTTTELELTRDDTFAFFAGHVVDPDGYPIEGATITVAGEHVQTDSLGTFSVHLPIEVQAEEQTVFIMKDGYKEVYREDECPSKDLIYIMYSATE